MTKTAGFLPQERHNHYMEEPRSSLQRDLVPPVLDENTMKQIEQQQRLWQGLRQDFAIGEKFKDDIQTDILTSDLRSLQNLSDISRFDHTPSQNLSDKIQNKIKKTIRRLFSPFIRFFFYKQIRFNAITKEMMFRLATQQACINQMRREIEDLKQQLKK